MKNREWLRNQSEYDLLCRMNEQLDKNDKQSDEFHPCIMDCFMDDKDSDKWCKGNCEKCIQAWLNEERR